jgi:MurNAc alpha-1-phosphate uridylyltransferase
MLLKQAMVFAAGYGKRLRPLTDYCPKPLIPLDGKICTLSRIFDILEPLQLERIVVNTHHLAPQIHQFLEDRSLPNIHISHEPVLLETGGGLIKALSYLDCSQPILIINGDVWWQGEDIIHKLCLQWNHQTMDILLGVIPKYTIQALQNSGDYEKLTDNKLKHKENKTSAPFVYMGVSLIHPGIFLNEERDQPCSLVNFFHRCEANNRLFGCDFSGFWTDMGTPESLEDLRVHVSICTTH